MKFTGLQEVRTQTHDTRASCDDEQRCAIGGALLMEMINKLTKVVHAGLTTTTSLWRNNRSITAFCHLTEEWKKVIEKVSQARGAVSVTCLSIGRH